MLVRNCPQLASSEKLVALYRVWVCVQFRKQISDIAFQNVLYYCSVGRFESKFDTGEHHIPLKNASSFVAWVEVHSV